MDLPPVSFKTDTRMPLPKLVFSVVVMHFGVFDKAIVAYLIVGYVAMYTRNVYVIAYGAIVDARVI